MFFLRRATQQDDHAIHTLINKVRINPFGLDWRRFVIAVNEKDELLGCGQIKPHHDGSKELASIAVQPDHQGKGIGTAIVQELLNNAPSTLYLTCRARMEPYYWRFGFQRCSSEKMTPYFRFIWILMSTMKWFFPKTANGRVMVRITP